MGQSHRRASTKLKTRLPATTACLYWNGIILTLKIQFCMFTCVLEQKLTKESNWLAKTPQRKFPKSSHAWSQMYRHVHQKYIFLKLLNPLWYWTREACNYLDLFLVVECVVRVGWTTKCITRVTVCMCACDAGAKAVQIQKWNHRLPDWVFCQNFGKEWNCSSWFLHEHCCFQCNKDQNL